MSASPQTLSSHRSRRPRKKSLRHPLQRVGNDEPSSSRRIVIEEHLLDIAAKRFASTGYRQTTLEEIARHAGIAKASMYRYFENKQELLTKIFVKVASTFTTSMQPILSTALPPEEPPGVRVGSGRWVWAIFLASASILWMRTSTTYSGLTLSATRRPRLGESSVM